MTLGVFKGYDWLRRDTAAVSPKRSKCIENQLQLVVEFDK